MTDDTPPLAPAIRLTNATVRYGTSRLVFDAGVEQGVVTAIVGASGAGKSTLLNLVAGFETPDEGGIEIFGLDATRIEPSARPVSVVFQDHNLFAHLDVATNIGLGLHPGLKLGPDDTARIAEALRDVGLDGFARRMPPTLSGGERQRVALARMLVRRRPILLLDEPFAALDPGLRSVMGDLLLALHRKMRNTVLLVTHHLDDVRHLADRVIFLDAGRVLVHEPASAFLVRTGPQQVMRFLGNPDVPA